MGDSKVTGLSQMSALALEDKLMFIDVSDATMSLNGTNKEGTLNQLGNFLKQFNNAAVENNYNTVADMIADQANQTQGNLQYVEDASQDPNVINGSAYYEYLNNGVGNLSDYRLLDAQESQVVANEAINRFKVKELSDTVLEDTSDSGISFYYDNTTNYIKEVVFSRPFSKYLVEFKNKQFDKKFIIKIYNTTQRYTNILEVSSWDYADVNDDFIKAIVVEDTSINFQQSDSVLVYVSVYKSPLNLLSVSTLNTGSVINMGFVGGNQCNKATPNANTTYTLTNLQLNGNATVRINAANEPTITGATKIAGNDFEANTNMDMCVIYDGTQTEYYFLKL